METPFGITKEEVLNLAAEKLANEFSDFENITTLANSLITKRVEELVSNGLKAKVDVFLTEEMAKILGQEICPVNIYGEREGSPTTIRAILSQRAKEFWEVKVDGKGQPASYGGSPRSKVMMQQILSEEFTKAIKDNADVIVGEFKTAMKSDAVKIIHDHIEKLIIKK